MQDVKCVTFTRISDTEIQGDLGLTYPPMLGMSGLALLVQIVIINLLKTPGKDFYEPDVGGGLLSAERGGTGTQGDLSFQSNIRRAVKAVEYQLKQSQLGENYPPSERLARLGLSKENSIFPLEDPRGFMVNLEIANEAGETTLQGVFVPANGSEG